MSHRYRVHPDQLNSALWLSFIFAALFVLVELSAGAPVTPNDNLAAALQPGTVTLSAGTFKIPATLVPPSGCNIIGQGSLTIIDASAVPVAFKLENVSGVNIGSLTISGPRDMGVYVNNVADSSIRNCTLMGIGWGGQINTAIFGYNPKRCDFSFNAFTNCSEGIHFFWKLGDKKTNLANRDDVTITYNTLRHVRRHPIELQEGVRGLKVRGNWIGDFDRQTNCMGISCATGGDPSAPGPDAWDIEIYENVIDGTGLQVGDLSQFAGMEVMGDTVNVHDNYLANIGQPFLVGLNSTNVRIQKNKVRGPKPPWGSGPLDPTAQPPQSIKMICGEYKYQPIPDVNLSGNAWTSDPTPPPPTTQPTTQASTQPSDPADPIVGIDVRLKSGKVQSFVPKAVQP